MVNKQNIKHMEFMKKIVVWAMIITTFFLIVLTTGFYITGTIPSEVVSLVGIIISGVIVSYSAKAGVENYGKIKNAGQSCENINENGGNLNG